MSAWRLSFLASVALLGSSTAWGESRWGLKWRAPDACISPADLAQLAEQELGRQVFGPSPDFKIDGTMQEGTSPRWKARLTVVSADGEVMGSRELTSDDADCRSLDKMLALTIAISIEPEREAPSRSPVVASKTPSTETPAKPEPPPHSVFVHIDADDKEVRLQRLLGTSTGQGYTSNGSVTVTTVHLGEECRAPCDEQIPRGEQRFVIGGTNISPAGPFVLTDHAVDGRVHLKVKAGNATAQNFGWYGGALLGTLGITFGALTVGRTDLLTGKSQPELGTALIVGGVVAAVVGVIVGVTNLTQVSFGDEKT